MKKILSVILAAAAGLSLQAQGVAFLNINPDPASAALAGTGIARTADAYALENNVAAAALGGPAMDVSVGYGRWQPQAAAVNVISAAGYYRITDKLALGLRFKDFAYPEYTVVSAAGRPGGSFSPMEVAFGLGAAYQLADGLSAGVSLHYVNSSLAEDAKASAFGADLALKFEKDGFHAGLSVNNLGSAVNYGNGNYSQPGIVRAGCAYSIAGLTASAEADYLFTGGVMAGLGLEYGIADIVFLRGGFHYGDAVKAIPTHASLGLGLKYAGVHLDVAFLTASKAVGNSLMASLGFAF